jgi:dihydrodipicolinate synthase/N-acetylneuraminate lyase
MKDSSGDWNNPKVFLDAFAKYGFDMFVGSESFLLANMRGGGAGCISATANVNPGPIDQLYREWQSSDAQSQQDRDDRASAARRAHEGTGRQGSRGPGGARFRDAGLAEGVAHGLMESGSTKRHRAP